VIPLFAFVRGDCLGLVVLVDARNTIGEVAAIAQRAAAMRVAPSPSAVVRKDGIALDASLTVEAVGLLPLDRIDVGAEG
jgi:hypothetical protein